MDGKFLIVGLVLVIVVGVYVAYSMQPEEKLPLPVNNTPAVDDTVPDTPLTNPDEYGNDSEIGKPCVQDSDCKLPYSYAMMSRCPYEIRCADSACEVFCPWDEMPVENSTNESNSTNETVNVTEVTEPEIVSDPTLEEMKEGVSVYAATDKSIYYSRETMVVDVTVSSDYEIYKCYIKAEGITNKYGAEKFVRSDLMHLKVGENNYTWEYRIPSCYGCSGLEPGEKNIHVWLETNEEEVLGEVDLELMIKDDE